MSVKLRRIYEPAVSADDTRVLVDRLWSRGLAKAEARIDVWMKEVVPSDGLRKWFEHDRNRWPKFRRRYAEELSTKADALDDLRALAARGTVTLFYGARDRDRNNAVVLKEVLERSIRRSRRRSGRRSKRM